MRKVFPRRGFIDFFSLIFSHLASQIFNFMRPHCCSRHVRAYRRRKFDDKVAVLNSFNVMLSASFCVTPNNKMTTIHNTTDAAVFVRNLSINQAYFFTDFLATIETGISETLSLGKKFLSLAEKILEFS